MLCVNKMFCKSIDSINSTIVDRLNKNVTKNLIDSTVKYNASKTIDNDISGNVTPRNFDICENFVDTAETQLVRLHGHGITVVFKIF